MPRRKQIDLTVASPGYARTQLNQFKRDSMVMQIDVIHRNGERFDAEPFVLAEEPAELPDGKVISTFRRAE